MPKLAEQKKQNKNETPKKVQQAVPPPMKPVEQKVVVFRVFEAIVHLEVAVAQLKQVGLFPGPAERAEEMKARLLPLVAGSEALLKEYKEIWGAMPKP